MHDPLRRRHRGRAPWHTGALALAILVLAILALALGVSMAGCGGSSNETAEIDGTAETGAATTAGTAAAETTLTTAGTGSAELLGTQLGEAIGDTWVEAMKSLNELLADLPEAETVKTQVQDLKEQYIQKLVTYGYQIEDLDEAARTWADLALGLTVNSAGTTDWYTTYANLYDKYAYMSGDVDFVNLIQSYNILTQYAYFELLKAQEPEEAARLGIE